MEIKDIQEFYIIGISVRTTNANGQGAKDIGGLWNRFMTEGIADKIPNKSGFDIYSVYTNYDGDYTNPYTTILGCKVNNIEEVPEGMVAHKVEAGSYQPFVAKGNLNEGVVVTEWQKIWSSDLARKYTSDFEIYGARAQNPEDAEVDIYIAI